MDPSPVAKLFVLPVDAAGHLLFEKNSRHVTAGAAAVLYLSLVQPDTSG
jgi:hypothetical protein